LKLEVVNLIGVVSLELGQGFVVCFEDSIVDRGESGVSFLQLPCLDGNELALREWGVQLWYEERCFCKVKG
jgi:hypothetical protein